MAATMLIAEVDEVGEVIWVWQADHGSGVARPLSRGAIPPLDPARVEVHGASFEAIAAWVWHRAEAAAPGLGEPCG